MVSLWYFCVCCLCILVAYGQDEENEYLPIPKDQAKGCYEIQSCERREFGGQGTAKCYGLFSCYLATFGNAGLQQCIGAGSCYKSSFEAGAANTICHGYKACQSVRPSLTTKRKIRCSGLKACSCIAEGIYSKEITCNGDLACSNYKSDCSNMAQDGSRGVMTMSGVKTVKCNGKATCRDNLIDATAPTGEVMCDGDAACQGARITAAVVKVDGKKVCKGCSITARDIRLWGFLGGVDSIIIPAERCKISAYGFFSFVNGVLSWRDGARLRFEAYGFRALEGATINCGLGQCNILCEGTGCKGSTVVVRDGNDFSIKPEGCDPCSPDFNCRKMMDDEPAAKSNGIFCPKVYMHPSRWNECRMELEDKGDSVKECVTPYFGIPTQSESEYVKPMDASLQQEINEVIQNEEEILNIYLDEKIADYEEEPIFDLPEYEMEEDREEALAFNMHSIPVLSRPMEVNNSQNLVISNLLTALCVFAICTAAVCYYYTRHILGIDTELKSLPEYE